MPNIQELINRRSRFDPIPFADKGGYPCAAERSPVGSRLVDSGGIVATSKAMREILEVVRRSAPTDAPVLIYGEPDTGKVLIASEVHRQSRRHCGPLVHVACGALRESDLAEKLFGNGEHGSGRDNRKPVPLVEEARGGTLFLEDVAQLPLWGQVRLMEVLQQGQHFGGAGNAGAGADMRVIASSTVDLAAAMAQRVFLSSLYYYLKVVEIHVPPLRHRSQDIGPLAENYLAIANTTRVSQAGRPPCNFSQDARQRLMQYDWPGNKLQLASVVAHAALLTDGDEISLMQIKELLDEVVPHQAAETISVPLIGGLKEIECAVVVAMIERCRGNKAEAARVLGLHRRELYRILERKASVRLNTMPPSVLGSQAGDGITKDSA